MLVLEPNGKIITSVQVTIYRSVNLSFDHFTSCRTIQLKVHS
jgi:hypothetical protein